jgi:surfactin synthase thioesterase subunit
VFSGIGDALTSVDENRAWERHTTADCRVEVFPGGHFFIFEQTPRVLSSVRLRLREWTAGSAR